MAVHISDGTAADVQAIHDDAGTAIGDIIEFSGSPSWTSKITNTKGLHIRGAGSGQVVANSASAVEFGTGAKVFTIRAARVNPDAATVDVSINTPVIANGTTLRIWKLTTSKDGSYMLGTVTSLVGQTLTMNITTNTGSGTENVWLFATEGLTIVTHDFVSGEGAPLQDALLSITENTTASAKISGIQFTNGTGNCPMIEWLHATGGKPIILTGVWFNDSLSGVDIIHNEACNRGIVSDFTVTATFWAQSNSQFFHSNPNARTSSWETPSTMGTADTDGTNNIYFESGSVNGFSHAAFDFDANTRAVCRYLVLNHSMINSHGCDTSPSGVRHVEYYWNVFIHDEVVVSGGFPIASSNFILLRGGTGAIHHNFFFEISGVWGAGSRELNFGNWALAEFYESPFHWSSNDGGVPEPPSPRQFGLGYVTGTGLDGHGRSVTDNGLYVGDPEPLYEWDNVYAGTRSISITTGEPNEPPPDDPNDYVREGIEYHLDTPKPGYTPFTFPHPLLEGGAPDPEDPPSPMSHNPGSHRNKYQLLFEWSRLVGGNPKPSHNELKLLRQIYIASSP